MNENKIKVELEKLKAENSKLKKELSARNEREKVNKRLRNKLIKGAGGIFLGWRLKGSIRKLFKEIEKKSIKRETLSDVITHVLWRFTRIGIFLVIVSLLPLTLIAIQTIILNKQTKIYENQFSIQNKNLEIEKHLKESERQTSQLPIFVNILERIDSDMNSSDNSERELSPQTIAMIISYSRALYPYNKVNGDLIQNYKSSPERGLLLSTLIKSDLYDFTYKQIYNSGDFSYSEIDNDDLYNSNFNEINLKYSNITNSEFDGSQFINARLQNSNLKDNSFRSSVMRSVNLSNCDLQKSKFRLSDLTNANISNAYLDSCDLFGVNLSEAKLTNSSLRYVDFSGAALLRTDFSDSGLTGAILDFVRVNSKNWIEDLRKTDINGTEELIKKYVVDTTDFIVADGNFTDVHFNLSWKDTMYIVKDTSMLNVKIPKIYKKERQN